MLKKAISLILSVSLILTQPVFAQGVAELNIGKYLNQIPAVNTDGFRPAHLRYISYDIKSNDFKLLLDQGDTKLFNSLNSQTPQLLNSSTPKLQDATQELFNYFLIGLSLPNEKFWVNLRPDAPQQIIDPELEKTDMGKIMLEADLQLKKDTAGWTSPQNPEGKEYWDKLYKKAGELFGTENITIPTITRPWIVPGEVIIREGEEEAYIYKANLKVMLEEDYIKSHQDTRSQGHQYNFNDQRMAELNKYSTQLIKELILPRLTQEVNTAKKYAKLRQVFFSLILSRWFKDKYKGKPGQYSSLIDSRNLNKLTSQESWSKDYYFNEYKKSFQQGEYNLKEQITTPTGQVIRSYVSGGIQPVLETKDVNSFAGSPLSEDKFINILDKIIAISSIAALVFLLYPKSLYPTFISKPTQQKIVLSKQADFDARYAIANLLDDKQLPSEDREKLKGVFSDYKVLYGKALLKATQDALDYFSAQEYKHEIASRLEKIRDGLKPAGSSPLTPSSIKPAEEVDMKYSSSSAGEKNIGQIVEKLNQEYEYYELTIVRAQRLFPGIVWPYLDYYSIKNETNIPIIIESLLETHKQIVNAWGGLNDPEDESPLKSDYMAALLKASNNFSNKIVAAIKELKQLSAMGDTGGSSLLTPEITKAQEQIAPLETGGIDFTRINYLTRPMGSFQGLDLRLPLLSKAELEGIDIKQEFTALERMINVKIDVSTDRLKRLLAAMSQKGAFNAQREIQLLPLLLRLCWLKEERGVETTPDFRAVLLIADTGLFVEQGNTKYSLN